MKLTNKSLLLLADASAAAAAADQSLDNMAKQQQISANIIFHAICNYKKSPTERKTLAFIAKNRQQLQLLWQKFHRQDKQIRCVYKDIEPQHGYFQKELYELVHEKYMQARCRLKRDKINLLKCNVC